MKSGGTRSETSGHSRSSYSTPTTPQSTIRSTTDAKEDDEDDYLKEKAPVAGVRALACNLAEALEEVAGPAMDSDDDGSDGAKPSEGTGR
ncbi:hypothetical protein PHMEG_0007470 [Phytophthora megakarya]|uniref:Eukaryotic/viral aspartic protease n=1 Tax=Phytophthora megakarya TaxID=4795 RepID=A0A225WL85_9STRA|nr:hypothetical protein PHMEG_0007470 [Phytophthora megakarya]